MSAFLSFVGGAAGEWNKMSEEQRIAKAEADKAKAKADAEIKKYREQKEIDEEFDIKASDRAATQKMLARQSAYTRMVPELVFRNKNDKENLHFISQAGDLPTFETIARPKLGYTYDELLGIIKPLNSELGSVKAKKRYWPMPPKTTSEDGRGWSYEMIDLEETTINRLAQDEDEANTQINAGIKTFTDLGYKKGDLNIERKVLKDGIQVSVSLKPEKTKKEDDPLANPNFLYSMSPKVGPDGAKEAHRRGFDIISLKADGTLNRVGEEAAKEIEYLTTSPQDQRDKATFLVTRRPLASDDKRTQATEGASLFFSDFTPEVVKKIVRNKATNPGAYRALELALTETIQNWNMGMAVSTEGGVRIPPMQEVYGDQLNELADLDGGLRLSLQSQGLTQRFVAEINFDIGEPINNPVTMLGDGGIEILKRPMLADTYAGADANNNRVYDTDFVTKASALALNGRIQVGEVYTLFDSAVDLSTGQGSREAVRKAFEGAIKNKDLLAKQDFFFVEAGRGQFKTPPLAVETERDIRANFSHFRTHQDAITSLQLAIPELASTQVEAQTLVATNVGREAKYKAVTGYNDYDDLRGVLKNAEQVMQTGAELERLLGQLDGDVGAVNTINLLTEGANYLIETFASKFKFEDDASMTGQELQDEIRQGLTSALSQSDDDAKIAALVRLNIKIQTYAYAAMLDPNGRLSDQDRQNAEAALGAEGISANPAAVLTTSRRLYDNAEKTKALIDGYRSNDTKRVVAADYYAKLTGGLETKIVAFLGASAEATERARENAIDQNVNDTLDLLFPPAEINTPTPRPSSDATSPRSV